MDKKKVGELDGTPIVTGKKNYANEHEYYLTMNEDNTYRKLEQRVSGDKFKLVLGGGGNDYPTPTAGDVNKVWQVTPVQKGVNTEEIVIVPEQTLVDEQELEYNDKFVPGAQCVAVIDGVEYRGEVVEELNCYAFRIRGIGSFEYDTDMGIFKFWNDTLSLEVTAKLSVIEEVPDYDYNWAPGVKIPIPTAEDEGKILVVTKVEGDNTSTIVPEQEVPANAQTPLTDVDLKYFIPGNTVTATVTIQQTPDEPVEAKGILLKGAESSNSETMIVSGIIKQADDGVDVVFNEGQEDEFYIAKIPYGEPEITPPIVEGPRLINTKSSTDTEYVLVTTLYEIIGGGIGPARGNTISYATIKLEYGEPDYEYQLQENSGGGGSTSIPTIDKNTQPNIVWREPTEEDLAKFHSNNIQEVADLPEGKLPLFLISKHTEDGVEYVLVQGVASVEPSISGNDTVVTKCDSSGYLVLSDDWSLLGTVGLS